MILAPLLRPVLQPALTQPLETKSGSGSSVPANALLQEDSFAILQEDGTYLLQEG